MTDVASGKLVALDAVCLDKVAPSSRWGHGFVVYLKRLFLNNQNPVWRHGFELEDKTSEDEPRRGTVLYHQTSKPHERANLIVELPELGMKLLTSRSTTVTALIR